MLTRPIRQPSLAIASALPIVMMLGATIAIARSGGSAPPAPPADAVVLNAPEVVAAAKGSSCAHHAWGRQQGVAPSGYVAGVALNFAKSYCQFRAGTGGSAQLISGAVGTAGSDILAFYPQRGISLPVAAPLSRLETTYALLLDLGMLESSARTGLSAPYDSANPHPDSLTAEAGLYQTSADSLRASPVLAQILSYYRSHPDECQFDLFTNNRHPAITAAIGTKPEGVQFQQFTKTCPAFATEYAATMLRVQRNHYGPVNMRWVEYAPVCQAMLRQIEQVVHCGP